MAERVLVWLLIERDGAVLLVNRKRPPFREVWVLPGDTMPEAESASETAARVLRDDFGVEVEGEEFLETLRLEEGGVEYAVNVFRVATDGRPRHRESGPYAEVGWAAPSELGELDIQLPPPLLDLLERLGSAEGPRPSAGGTEVSPES